MKIAFLTPEYPHHKTGVAGGIGTSIKNLAENFVHKGHTVRILVYAQPKDDFFEDNGIVVQQIKNIKFKGFSWYLTRKKIQKLIDDLYAKSEIDIVESPDWTGITSFIQPKVCPIIIKLHGSDTYFCHLDNRPVKLWNRYHEKIALKKADGIISVSDFTAKKTKELFKLNLAYTVIPNGISLKMFDSNESNISNNSNIILYFGTLIRKKGLLELPHIFNQVISMNPAAKLILVGRDSSDIITGNASTWQMMQELFSSNALKNVQYLGSVPYHEIRDLIANATVCVFPSFAEAFPVSWLEAMAMGKAVAASNIGWASEVMIHQREGFLINPQSHELYASAIVKLLEDDKLREQIGMNAKDKVLSSFDIQLISERLLNFYSKYKY